MEYFEAIKTERTKILNIFYDGFRRSYVNAWRRPKSKPREEDFIARFVSESTPRIYNKLHRALAPHNISVSIYSIFCHRSPFVKFAKLRHNKYVEIGDLLFIHFHKHHGKTILRNGLLLQAKTVKSIPHRLSNNETDQLLLYSEWPKFKYVKFGSLSGNVRIVEPSMPNSGAQYLLIDKNSPKSLQRPGHILIETAMPERTLINHQSLHHTLYQFLYLHAGRTFGSFNKARRDWDRVMWDLLIRSRHGVYNLVNSGYSSEPKFSGDSLTSKNLFFNYSAEGISGEDMKNKLNNWLTSFENEDIPPRLKKSIIGRYKELPGISTIFITTDYRGD